VIAWQEYLDGLRPTKVVLYAPTWRHGREATRFFPFGDFDETELGKFFEEQNTLLLLRPHAADYWKYTDLRDFMTRLAHSSSLIKLSSQDEFPDVNTIMPFVDVLITDYSAIYHDFLLLNRPLVFIPYDFEEFERNSGFLYNYHGLLPGPTVDSFASFKVTLCSVLSGVDSHKPKRKYLQKLIHEYQDAAACERIVQLIDDLLS
jgi:CDP-glycerol glycerophosphotransferase (TagB/SpsB family)